MQKSHISALTLFLATSDAYADEQVMQRFTQSMSELYATATLCEYALSPSPISYARSIRKYVQRYYTDVDSVYWVLPEVNGRARNSAYCSTRLQQGLMRYALARNDFAINYEDHPSPPHLAAVKERPVRVIITRRAGGTASGQERFKDQENDY